MMRCRQCDHPNPEDHRFCGMCGSRLEPLAIDDNDPLAIETPVYEFERRSLQTGGGNRQREMARDRSSRNVGTSQQSSRYSSTAIENSPREIDSSEEHLRRQSAREAATGIGGPSFLGLNYDSANSGFIYDKPRDGGFVYDSDGKDPEYLLEEIPRGVSWRAWALFLLLLIGAGLGYVQWQASHHQGPDLASILARNGPTVDPSGPVMPDKNAKPADKKSASAETANSADANAEADDDSQQASSNNSENKSADANSKAESSAASAKDVKASDANSTKTKAADVKKDENDDDSENASATVADGKGNAGAGKPESDGPSSKTSKSARSKPVVEEEPPQPKPLGDKDPLIVQADKYIQGRGVPKNCSKGVNLLREAVSAGNPAADVKFGALYWSGTCVTQSKVTAYEWFSRAHSLEPKNRWVERSRNSLWASMDPAEKRRVGGY